MEAPEGIQSGKLMRIRSLSNGSNLLLLALDGCRHQMDAILAAVSRIEAELKKPVLSETEVSHLLQQLFNKEVDAKQLEHDVLGIASAQHVTSGRVHVLRAQLAIAEAADAVHAVATRTRREFANAAVLKDAGVSKEDIGEEHVGFDPNLDSEHIIWKVVSSLISDRLSSLSSTAVKRGIAQQVQAALETLESLDLMSAASLLEQHGIHCLRELMTITPQRAQALVGHLLTYVPPEPDPQHSGFAIMQAPLISLLDRGIVKCEPDNIIGTGRFGLVYGCQLNNQPAALKMVQVGASPSAFQATMRVVEEAKHLMSLNHPNILEYFDVFGHQAQIPGMGVQNYVCILMELCDQGCLSDVVFEKGLTFEGIVDFLRQAASGLAYAHAHAVVHYDCKLENILITRTVERDIVKIGDWGVARREPTAIGMRLDTSTPDDERALFAFEHPNLLKSPDDAGETMTLLEGANLALKELSGSVTQKTSTRGTLCYQAPECIDTTKLKPGLTWACDLWSLGCVLFEATTSDLLPLGTGDDVLGRVALCPEKFDPVKRKLVDKFEHMLRSKALAFKSKPAGLVEATGKQLLSFLKLMWDPDATQRPAAMDIAAHLPQEFVLRVEN